MSESPMEQAAGQAAQTAAMSVRFLVTVAMAVAERQAKENPDLAARVERLRQLDRPTDDAAERYADMVRGEFKNPSLRDALLTSEQWPQIVSDLRHLETAGIDVKAFLGDAGRIAERIAATLNPQPTPEQMVREHLGDRLADTLVNSERWPQIADEMRQMQAAGISLPQMLRAAAEPGAKVEATMDAAWRKDSARAERLEKETAPVRSTSEPVPESRRGRRDGDKLGSRKTALEEAGLSPQQNQRYVRMVRDHVEDQHTAMVLVASRQWPSVAASMRDLEDRNIDPGPRLSRLPQVAASQAAKGGRFNLVDAAQEALRHPAPASRVTGTAARRNSGTYTPKAEQKTSPTHTGNAAVKVSASDKPMAEKDPAKTKAASATGTAEKLAEPASAADGSERITMREMREAAHHVVDKRDGVNAATLRDGLGVSEGQAQALVTALSRYDIIGRYDPATDRHQVQVDSTKAADLVVDGTELTARQANKAVAAEAARTVSRTAEAPQAKTSEPEAAAARTAPPQTNSKGRTR